MEKLMTMKVFWMAMMLGIVSGNENHATTCQLDKKLAGALCAVVKLLEASNKVAGNYNEHYLKKISKSMKLFNIKFDQSKRVLPEMLDERKKTNAYTSKELTMLSDVFGEALTEFGDSHEASEEAIGNAHKQREKAIEAVKQALGEDDTGQNCNSPSSPLHFIRCYGPGGNGVKPTTVPLHDVCKDQDYWQHQEEGTDDKILTRCDGEQKYKKYCRDMGTPLEEALNRFFSIRGKRPSSESSTCPSTTAWENSIKNATRHMKQLAEMAQRVEEASHNSTAYLSAVRTLHHGLQGNECIQKIAQDTMEATQAGAIVALDEDNSSAVGTWGTNGTNSLKVKVNVTLGTLKKLQTHAEETNRKCRDYNQYLFFGFLVLAVLFVGALGVLWRCVVKTKKATHASGSDVSQASGSDVGQASGSDDKKKKNHVSSFFLGVCGGGCIFTSVLAGVVVPNFRTSDVARGFLIAIPSVLGILGIALVIFLCYKKKEFLPYIALVGAISAPAIFSIAWAIVYGIRWTGGSPCPCHF